MGRFILFVGAGFVSVVVLTLMIALWMPRTWHVSATEVSATPPDEIWSVVSDLRTWPEWSIWSVSHDPALHVEFLPSSSVSAPVTGFAWRGDAAGSGVLTIEAIDSTGRQMRYRLQFEEAALDVTGEVAVRPTSMDGASSIVNWRVYGDAGPNPFARLSVDLIRKVVTAETRENLDGLLAWFGEERDRTPSAPGVFTPPQPAAQRGAGRPN